MGEEAKWIRKASGVEISMDVMNKSEMLLVAYRLSFSARRPVQAQEVQQALRLLFRKTPNLRVCLAEKDGEKWFKEVDEKMIDFEVSTVGVEEVTQFIHTESYPEDGTLWRARLVPVATPCYHPQHLSSFHADLQDTFPHCYHLMFGFSHAIGDGHTFIRICAAFSHILDSVLSGQEVDTEQIGCFDLNEEYDRKTEEMKERLFKDEAWKEECIREVNQGKPESDVLQHLLSPSEDCPKKTLLYTQTLDKTATTRLVEKCRAAKVTLSSCMAAACNLALVDLVVEKGVVQDTYSVSNMHMINMRRTWPKETTERAFGCYIASSLRQFFVTPRTVSDDQFWQYAKEIHSKFYGLLQDERFTEKAAFVLWCYGTGNMQHVQKDLSFNTRGNITQRFEGTKEITVTNLLSSSSIHKSSIPWDDVVGTVRGRLSHTTKYNTSMVSEDTALRYSDLVYARLLKIATS
ncbi:uncharacterized protein LOC123504965 [Portunus trituberculatus]|uniref:uncharacterized protein LOC123504965 n=1 Tax=Portunus trituberculatus TaxID=210409 RepID=UPI001E1CFC07|nr:uncharacterized protein LOC123504965 [Portunus trituberculatus]